jgi:RNA polymerase sigma-70 factor (ECF subfamily)
MDDLELAKQGDSEALGRLIEAHSAAVGRVLWRFTRDRSEWESLVQETFVQMFRSLGSFRGDAGLEHWLVRIATRVGFRYWTVRRRERERTVRLSDQAMRGLSADPAPTDAAQLLHELLERLEPPERLALTLVHLEGLGLRAAAARAGWSEGGMKMRLMRARRRLAEEARACGLDSGDLQ